MFERSSKILLAAAVVLGAGVASASAGNLVTPNQPKLKVTKTQLGIKGPITNVCPTTAKMRGWIFTNKPGKLQYMIARKGGTVSGPFSIISKKGSNGVSMATFSRNLSIHHKINAHYRILIGAKYGGKSSYWVPLKASCKI